MASFPEFSGYTVVRPLSEIGMGCVLLMHTPSGRQVALKYCHSTETEQRARFSREVKIQEQFASTGMVIPIVESNLSHEPPYFTMPFAPGGNLLTLAPIADLELQEKTFRRMISCVKLVHDRGHFHRDIKPQNFLILDKANPIDQLVLADFGLAKRTEGTTFTATGVAGGTEEYAPPEYFAGEFKHATAAWDVFTLGKSFYRLITDRHALHLHPGGIPTAIFKVISKCCEIGKENRYQSVDDLASALQDAYDVCLGRNSPDVSAFNHLTAIKERLSRDNKYSLKECQAFVRDLSNSGRSTQYQICKDIGEEVLRAYSHAADLEPALLELLSIYEDMVCHDDYPWSFADKVAAEMNTVFKSAASDETRALALSNAIHAAHIADRYDAMDRCVRMILTIPPEGDLGLHVAEKIRIHGRKQKHFLRERINPLECPNALVSEALIAIRG